MSGEFEWVTTISHPWARLEQDKPKQERQNIEGVRTSLTDQENKGQEERLLNAKERLQQFVENQPFIQYDGDGKWRNRWVHDNGLAGDTAITTLLPRNIKNNARIFNHVIERLNEQGWFAGCRKYGEVGPISEKVRDVVQISLCRPIHRRVAIKYQGHNSLTIHHLANVAVAA